MKIFLAGGTGVIGRRVVPLLTSDHDVTVNVRNDQAGHRVTAAGAEAVSVDLFDRADVARAVAGHDAVINMATSIPSAAKSASKKSWVTNDRLRIEAAANLASAAAADALRYIGESVTFPYAENGASWIGTDHPYSPRGTSASVASAEQAAASVTDAGGTGVTLRFAMFFAADSPHINDSARLAKLGVFALPGSPDDYISFIDADDAAQAVVAALTAKSGVYNVAEADPRTRGEHARALAKVVGRRRLRHVPGRLLRLGGEGADDIARSHRISSSALGDATGWKALRSPIDTWNLLA